MAGSLAFSTLVQVLNFDKYLETSADRLLFHNCSLTWIYLFAYTVISAHTRDDQSQSNVHTHVINFE